MGKTFLPLFTVPCVTSNQKTIFHTFSEQIVVTTSGRLMRQLIGICDGHRSLNKVVGLLKDEWDESSVRDLLRELRRRGVLTDSRYFNEVVWKTVENPSRFPSFVTDNTVVQLVKRAKEHHKKETHGRVYKASSSAFGRLLNHRRSVRAFSNQPVKLQSVINMLWSAYGEVRFSDSGNDTIHCRRTVPSAGALYPLMIHVALFKKTGELLPAVYRIHMASSEMVGFNLVSEDISRFICAFVDPLMLDTAHGVIVVSGSFHTTGEKYGNRSILYVPLEAGHVAQNIHLAAVECCAATVEIGGFVEGLLAEAINLPKHYRPLTTVVFGHEGNIIQKDTLKSGVEVHWAVPVAGQYQLPFTMAFARVSPKINEDWSCGRAVSPRLAYIKATAEAREWAACACVPTTLAKARLADLGTAIDPRGIIKFHPSQYRMKGFPFEPFSEKVEYAWAEGKDEMRESVVHILADCVYFPYYPRTPQYAHANSSGVAAHLERQQAIKNSVLELVERDSFMIAYLAKLVLPTVSEKTLPHGIQKRIINLRKNGFMVRVKDYSLDLAPVVFVFAQNKELIFTTCAGCAGFDTEAALDHALMEVESSVLCRLANGPLELIRLSKVRFPSDHGRLYEQKRFFQRADFLIRGQNPIMFQEIGRDMAQSWQGLLDRFIAKGWPLVTIPLHLTEKFGGNDGLFIIRSIVPGMVPISFGYREEPRGMERIRVVAREIGGVSISYRDMPRFPHPYT